MCKILLQDKTIYLLNMYINNCDICKYVQQADREIFSTRYWLVALSKDQSTIGRSYLSLKDHKGSLSQLSSEQWGDYIKIVSQVEDVWRKAFGAAPINWACMMNFAYHNTPPNPHVHWHIRPRYAQKVSYAGLTFEDAKFGYHYDPAYRREVEDKKTTQQIIDKLKSFL